MIFIRVFKAIVSQLLNKKLILLNERGSKMDSEKYLPSLFRQSIIVFYKTIDEFNEIVNYFTTERREGYISSVDGKGDWAIIIFKDGSVIRLVNIKDLNNYWYRLRWTSIMVTSGCTKEDIEILKISPLLCMSNGSYANENIMRIKKPGNIFSGAKPVEFEEGKR